MNPNMSYLSNRPREKGVVEKCHFCLQRTREGRMPACLEVCPVGARKFGNILDPDTFPRSEPYDAVFCRNVLIYFSEPALKAAIETFAETVRPGGLLFLGHSESIIGLTQAFQAERFGQCIAYRRKDP